MPSRSGHANYKPAIEATVPDDERNAANRASTGVDDGAMFDASHATLTDP